MFNYKSAVAVTVGTSLTRSSKKSLSSECTLNATKIVHVQYITFRTNSKSNRNSIKKTYNVLKTTFFKCRFKNTPHWDFKRVDIVNCNRTL